MKTLRISSFLALCVFATVGCAASKPKSARVAPLKPSPVVKVPSRVLIADNQQFLALMGTTDNKGKFKNTYQNWFRVKAAATDLVFPLVQSYSSWNEGEDQKEFSNSATFRAAVSLNKGAWTPLTWNGASSKECALRDVIWNDPLKLAVKPGDILYFRTEITVPAGGKWGLGPQARGDSADPDPNWVGGGTNSADDVLLSDKADFRPQSGLFTNTAQGVFGHVVGQSTAHPTVILGDSISPYVLTAADKVGNDAPLLYFGQPAETAARFWHAGYARQKLLGGEDTMLYQYAVNDLRSRGSFADLQSDALNTWKAFKNAGGKHLIVFTATPLSRSTDGWKTVANQTPDFEPDVRTQWNDFLRALSTKQTGLQVTVVDTAKLLETAPNSSIWNLTPEGAPATDDGCHPNGAGYAWIERGLGEEIRAAIRNTP